MKHKAQVIAAVLFLLSFIKSFKYSSNAYDIVFIILCACIYTLYEILSKNKLEADIQKLTIDTDNHFKEVEKEMKDTKSYVSTISLGHTYNTKR
jgi:uncharacterized membrane protein